VLGIDVQNFRGRISEVRKDSVFIYTQEVRDQDITQGNLQTGEEDRLGPKMKMLYILSSSQKTHNI
jgi:hypothetical protein